MLTGARGKYRAGNEQHVVATFTEGRQGHRHLGNTEIEVLSKQAIGNHFLEIAMGGAHHPHVYGNGFAATNALHHPFLQKAQQFGLQGCWHVADFI